MVGIFHGYIASLSEPVAHGTTSNNLSSILEKGLGGFFPTDSFTPGRISVCSLRYPEGLYAPYAAALRWGFLFNSDLCIDARDFGGRDLVQRYITNRGYKKWQAIRTEIKIKLGGVYYCLKKQRVKGWPTLFVYDAKEVKLTQMIGTGHIEPLPSHFVADSPLPKETLALMLVSAKRNQEAEQIISRFGLNIPVLPMELIELEEILSLSQQRTKSKSNAQKQTIKTYLY